MPATAPAAAAAPHRHYLPADLDISNFDQLSRFLAELVDRRIDSAQAMSRWLEDYSELSAAIDEYGSRRYIDKSCHTDDEAIKKRFLQFVEEVEPRIKPFLFRIQKKYIASEFRPTNDRSLQVMERRWRAEVELFREENVSIETEVILRVTKYDEINGRMMVNYRGEELTLQQIAKFGEEPDRAVRQETWEISNRRRLADHEAIESIYEGLLPLRDKIAKNAGLSDFRAYQWKVNKRFDYTPEDCLRFADAIAETCVPLVRKLDEQRAKDLNLPKLRPWDVSVDPKGRPPLRPFDATNIELFVQKTRAMFQKVSPALALDFDQLRAHGNLDLQSRKGKQPGGYLMPLEESRQPFIFMNAAGLQRDIETLLHEGGHAFHHLAAAGVQPLVFLRTAPMEFCEVASMSMELLGGKYFAEFYPPADAARAWRTMLEGIVRFFPWMATIDSFQHWIYTHPGHTRSQRQEIWLGLLDRFASRLDWSVWEITRQTLWQRQTHLFHSPFYYIEYGIAQLGALQLWQNSLKDPAAAVEKYRSALALGGSRPLPELFSAAGIVFDFSQKTLRPLMDALDQELQRLPR